MTCELHTLDTPDAARRFVHGAKREGGIDVCDDCLLRVVDHADPDPAIANELAFMRDQTSIAKLREARRYPSQLPDRN